MADVQYAVATPLLADYADTGRCECSGPGASLWILFVESLSYRLCRQRRWSYRSVWFCIWHVSRTFRAGRETIHSRVESVRGQRVVCDPSIFQAPEDIGQAGIPFVSDASKKIRKSFQGCDACDDELQRSVQTCETMRNAPAIATASSTSATARSGRLVWDTSTRRIL